MADISTWSPTDESNTAAPPAGWPENMQPSAVNNSARGMMGAIRRWYDTVTAQIASLTTSLGNYLPLSGGTLSGTLSAPQYNISGVLFAKSDGTTIEIYDPAGGASIGCQAAFNLYDADTHIFRNNATVPSAQIDSVGNLTLSSAYIHFSGSGGTINATGGPLLYADSSNHVYKQGSGNGSFFFENYAGGIVASINSVGAIAASSLNVTGAITAAGNITAPAFIGNVTVPASGPISTGGTVTGGTVTSTGNINAAGYMSALGYQTRAGTAGALTSNYFNIEWRPGAHLWIDNVHQGSFVLDTGSGISTSTVTATTINASSQVTSTGGFFTTDATGGNSFVIYSPPGANASFIQFLVGWYLHFNGLGGALSWFADSNLFWMMRYADHTCLNNLGPVAGLGAYINLSDRRGKTDIVPTTKGLAEVLRLSPVEFSRTSTPDRRELGFVAQDVEDVLPEAVRRVGITLPDGTGGPDDAEPTLGITDSTIVAALVNAAKELAAENAALTARVAALEETHHV